MEKKAVVEAPTLHFISEATKGGGMGWVNSQVLHATYRLDHSNEGSRHPWENQSPRTVLIDRGCCPGTLTQSKGEGFSQEWSMSVGS